MKITDELIDYIAKLSRLHISPDERERLAHELSALITYVETLSELDTSDMDAMSHVHPVKNVFREDMVRPSHDRETLLREAPHRDGEAFIVPKTVE